MIKQGVAQYTTNLARITSRNIHLTVWYDISRSRS